MRKCLSILLAVLMVITAFPLTAISSFAAVSGDFEYKVISEEEKTCEITGYTGSAAKVEIPGTIDEYSVTSLDWGAFYNCTSLENVTIPGSVTSIDDGAFYGCTSLASINVSEENTVYSSIDGVLFNKDKTEIIKHPVGNLRTTYIIPDSVIAIGPSAFKDCTSLESIIISDNTTSIGENAFKGCGSLASITIPDSITSIGRLAFNGCESLESVTIPDGVASIGDSVFFGCTSLESINVSEDNTVYSSVDGVLFNKDKTELIQYPLGSARTEYTTPYGVTTVVESAFYGSVSLESLTISESVTTIGDYAFENSTALANISIPDSVTTIGDYAFLWCLSLANINVSNDNTVYSSVDGVLFNKDKTVLMQYPVGNARTAYTIPDSVTKIGDYAFYGCTTIENITILDSVTLIDDSAFAGCMSLESVTMGNGIKTIGDYAFAWCYALTDISIPDGTTVISDFAFDSCSALESITIPDSVISIGQNVIWGTAYYYDETNWENNVLYVDNHIIEAKDTISGDYAIKDGTKTIAYSAFRNCTSLKNITIPNSVVSIGSHVFYKCTSLEKITIPDSVISIDYRAFGYCTSLENVAIGAGATYIGEGAFRNCTSLNNIEVSKDNASFTSVDGVLFNKDKTELIQYPIGKLRTTYIIPDSVTSIGYSAFRSCTSLANIVIGNSVTTIGEYAFNDCTSLADVYYKGTEEQWNEVIIETDGTFKNANMHYNYDPDIGFFEYKVISEEDKTCEITGYVGNATELEIPATINDKAVVRIGDGAFKDNQALTSVTVGAGIEDIGASAFENCTALSTISLPDTITHIGEKAIYNTAYYNDESNWKEKIQDDAPGGIEIGNGTPTVPWEDIAAQNLDYLYLGTNLIELTYSGSYTLKTGTRVIADGAVANSDATSITLSAQLVAIGNNAFANCKNLTTINFKDSVEFIGDYAFTGCTSLANITIPKNVKSIGDSAFALCTSLESINVAEENAVYSSVDGVLFNKDKTELLQYPIGKTETEYAIPDGVISIGTEAFALCQSLESVTIPSSVTTIGKGAFSFCTSLAEVIMQDSVTSIGEWAFQYCASLENVIIPDSVTFIGEKAFIGCASLTDVYYKGTKEQWNEIEIPKYHDTFGNITVHYNYGHNIDEEFTVDKEPTCTEDGQKSKHCADCDLIVDVTVIPALGHDFDEDFTIDIEPTYEKDGSKSRHCSRCDEVTDVTVIPKLEMPKNGWTFENDNWVYYENGKLVTNAWRKDSKGWCYLGEDGKMVTNQWVEDSVGVCYVGADGYWVKNCWIKDSIGWRYVTSKGYLATNQWIKDSVGWCYLGADGYCVTNCWKKDSIGWCYLGADGRMVTNKWVKDSVTWCYVGADGYCVTNAWKADSKGWCYLDANGRMMSNSWLQWNGNWYYLDENGYMVTGTKVINGKTYSFASNGICLNK